MLAGFALLAIVLFVISSLPGFIIFSVKISFLCLGSELHRRLLLVSFSFLARFIGLEINLEAYFTAQLAVLYIFILSQKTTSRL